jgi:hypothetical protein
MTLAGLLLSLDSTMEEKVKADRRITADRRTSPRGGRRATDQAAQDREWREQQVVKYLRKQEPK